MKYWKGYLTAAILLAFTWALREFARTHSALVDMIYPYVTRMAQNFLAGWSGDVTYCLWQMLLLVLLALIIASAVLMVILKWNAVQWFGWVCAIGSILVFCNFGLLGLNEFAGPLSEDIRLNETDYSITELENAAAYYRDQANTLANQIKRDEDGNGVFSDFNTLANQAGEGFDKLVYNKSLSIFAGTTLPVKALGWANQFTAWGITGMTIPLTGEAAVNPQQPAVMLPFAMCQEMAYRMSIAIPQDASFAAYLSCKENSDVQFRYSGALMGYRYCIKALQELDAVTGDGAAARVAEKENFHLKHDMAQCDAFFGTHKLRDAKTCDLLTSWHIQEIVLPSLIVEEEQFDPLDKTQVDLT